MLSMTPFHVCEIFEDPDDVMWCYQTLLKNVVDENAPLRKKTLKKTSGTLYERGTEESNKCESNAT